MITKYNEFIAGKAASHGNAGFEPIWMPPYLFGFQRDLTEWSIKKGRSAIFADCGLGKTPMQLVWAENVARKTGGNVMILAPLSVSSQTVREGEKFDVDVTQSRDGETHRITITNYEQIDKFDPNDFIGIVLDESSILKNYSGKIKAKVIDFMYPIHYRLLCSATPSPNDHMELGTSSEALGVMSRLEMLASYFTHNSGETAKWTIKGHAEDRFWEWVASWAQAIRSPSDFGYDEAGFDLPPMTLVSHVLESDATIGGLFPTYKTGLNEERREMRKTINDRCEKVAEIANSESSPFVAWCSLNDEGDLLEKLCDDSVQVAGRDSNQAKIDKLKAFASGDVKCIVTKPSIAGFGLNWQHCHRMSFFPSHSYEQFYQATRRCYRFGQTKTVNCHIVTTESLHHVVANLQRKEMQVKDLFSNVIEQIGKFQGRKKTTYNPTEIMEVPEWLVSH